jgi:hypothetical protein
MDIHWGGGNLRKSDMLMEGADYLKDCINHGNFTAKMVFNEKGAIIFSVQT